jgi:FMN reductase
MDRLQDSPASSDAGSRPLVVGLGGTLRAGSSSESALRLALAAAEREGARVEAIAGPDLEFPMYAPEREERPDAAVRMIDLVRRADGLILASPGYHGTISGLVKNALDYVEDLREDPRPYLDGRAVACVASAAGWQAATSTLGSLRSIVHALRGWPTPLGVVINSEFERVGGEDESDARVVARLSVAAGQVVEFARLRAAVRGGPSSIA